MEPTKVCSRCNLDKPWTEYCMRKAARGAMRPQPRCKDCANRVRAEVRKIRQQGALVDKRETVDVSPFSDWLRHLMDRDKITQTELAIRLDMDERHLRILLHKERRTVTVDLVDRVLCHEGSAMLMDLYPDLYEVAKSATDV